MLQGLLFMEAGPGFRVPNESRRENMMLTSSAIAPDQHATIPQHARMRWQLWLLWGYLLIVSAAEFVTFAVDPYAGQIVHALLLVVLLIHGAVARNEDERKLALALTLAPMTRLLSLSLPLLRLPQIAWYPVVAAPLLLGAWLLIRQLRLSRVALGLRPGKLVIEAMLAAGGLGLGMLEYSILNPQPVFNSFTWETFGLALLIFTLATGLPEELIFRGIFQATALPVLGKYALLYVALLFAVLHIGYLSVLDVVFVFAVGLLFAYIAQWSGSILGLTLSHGVTNTTLFFILPYAYQHPSALSSFIETWVIGIGSGLGIFAIALIAVRARSAHFQAQLAALTVVASGLEDTTASTPVTSRKVQMSRSLLPRRARVHSATTMQLQRAHVKAGLYRGRRKTFLRQHVHTQLPVPLRRDYQHLSLATHKGSCGNPGHYTLKDGHNKKHKYRPSAGAKRSS